MVQVLSVFVPAQVAITATARVMAVGATYDEIVEAGLGGLRESRSRLFGYGIEGVPRGDGTARLTGDYTVYAHRD